VSIRNRRPKGQPGPARSRALCGLGLLSMGERPCEGPPLHSFVPRHFKVVVAARVWTLHLGPQMIPSSHSHYVAYTSRVSRHSA
jgi:hypothetical protein